MRVIVSMGSGGRGKTSFVGLMTKYFIDIGEGPLLLIDADPERARDLKHLHFTGFTLRSYRSGVSISIQRLNIQYLLNSGIQHDPHKSR